MEKISEVVVKELSWSCLARRVLPLILNSPRKTGEEDIRDVMLRLELITYVRKRYKGDEGEGERREGEGDEREMRGRGEGEERERGRGGEGEREEGEREEGGGREGERE